MILYIIQVLIFQGFFLLFYELLLKKETFFKLNRAYLLLAPLVALVLPLVKISLFSSEAEPTSMIRLPEIGLMEAVEKSVITGLSWNDLFIGIWVVGSLLFFGYFLKKLQTLQNYRKEGAAASLENGFIINLPNSTAAFSFLKTIFIGQQLTEEQRHAILLHEQVHVKEHHSWDLLLFEALIILFWFNPFVYLFQKRMIALQEFIADAKVSETLSKKEYYQSLLSQLFQTQKISFINTFFNHSLIKKRIVMLQKSKSKKSQLLKYTLLLPIIAAMVFVVSCAEHSDTPHEENTSEAPLHLKQEVQATPFATIDKAPIFPGCEEVASEAQKNCFTQKVAQFVIEKFDTKVASEETTGKQRISVQFKINSNGRVEDVKARAADEKLQAEAIRVIEMLPKMVPGEQDGKKVSVQFALPILFEF